MYTRDIKCQAHYLLIRLAAIFHPYWGGFLLSYVYVVQFCSGGRDRL